MCVAIFWFGHFEGFGLVRVRVYCFVFRDSYGLLFIRVRGCFLFGNVVFIAYVC